MPPPVDPVATATHAPSQSHEFTTDAVAVTDTKVAAKDTDTKLAAELARDDSLMDNAAGSESDVEGHVRPGGASNASALYHVICVIAGAGILQIPEALKQSGWAGTIMLVFSAYVNDYTGKMLVKCLYQDGKRIRGGYPDIGRIAFGRIGEYIVQFFYYSMLLGTAFLFLILSGENLARVSGWQSKKEWILICAAMVCVPFIALRTLKEVAIASFFGAFATVVVTVMVCVYGLLEIGKQPVPITYNVIDIVNFPIALGTFSFSYGGNFVYAEVEHSMATPKAFPKVLTLAMIIITVLYAATGVVGYATYGQTVLSPILNSLPKGPAATAAFVIITMHALFACPLVMTTFSAGFERMLNLDTPKDTPRIWATRTALRLAVVLVCTSISYFLPFFKNLIVFIGAVSSTMLIYIFPILFYYKLFGLSKRSYLELGFAVIIMIVGFVCGTIGGIQSVIDLGEDIRREYRL